MAMYPARYLVRFVTLGGHARQGHVQVKRQERLGRHPQGSVELAQYVVPVRLDHASVHPLRVAVVDFRVHRRAITLNLRFGLLF